MEVTRENFDDALEELKKELAKCDFVAIDTELSGAPSSPHCPPRLCTDVSMAQA